MTEHSHGWDPEIAAQKARNRVIFEETLKICRAGEYVAPSGRVVRLPPKEEVLAASRFYVNPPKVDDVPTAAESVVDAVEADCIDVARELVAEGFNPVMLNMANRHTPGGGVLDGARAQEETLFRRSNLCVSLYQYGGAYHAELADVPQAADRYPMDRDTGGIYSGKVMFFRRGVKEGYGLVETPFTCAVVSVAAINRPDVVDGRLVPWAEAATMAKIRSMLRIGLLHGHDAIVLGAFGCGAFRNPPAHVAELFHAVLREPEFANKYRRVRFAVIEDHNSLHSNYQSFAKEFSPQSCPLTGESEGESAQGHVEKTGDAQMSKKAEVKGVRTLMLVNGEEVMKSGSDELPVIARQKLVAVAVPNAETNQDDFYVLVVDKTAKGNISLKIGASPALTSRIGREVSFDDVDSVLVGRGEFAKAASVLQQCWEAVRERLGIEEDCYMAECFLSPTASGLDAWQATFATASHIGCR